ncbi:2,5-dioxovalerate dehydrogenase [Halocatena halophila]|uniref:2,5-dioxovalerate dehydrogenase n=1 Tax=Halocatena halophila TaxID=2814576 RepID=UPI002ED4743B
MTPVTDNYVDGEWCSAEHSETFSVTNPATGAVVGEYQSSTENDVERAIEAAVSAQDTWAMTPGPQRGEILRRTAGKLDARAEELTELLVTEEGKTWSEAAGEVGRAVDIFYYYAEKARDLGGQVKSSSAEETQLYTVSEPLGVAAIITPWNYPIAIPAWKLAPALASGNTVVFKPASGAPGVGTAIVECLEAAGLPEGVCNCTTGSGSVVVSPLLDHEDVDSVSFTGSTSVGTHVAQTAADDLKRVQCEMGGKNPTVVMPSADLTMAAEIVASGGFGTTGQSCTATSRAIVHTDVVDAFTDELVEQATSYAVGPGIDDPDMGPQVSKEELDSTLSAIADGTSEGATLETGGKQLEGDQYDDGHFVAPTVFSGVEPSMSIARDEIFGPVVSVIETASFDAAIELANDSRYGLAASIVTDDHTEATRFINEVEAGVVKVNEKTTGLELHVPFGGMKDSSTNTYREQGDAGLEFFTTTKTVYDAY